VNDYNYHVYIALASNVSPDHHFGMAWRLIEEKFSQLSESSIYKTESVSQGDDYKNQVILIETSLDHDALKAELRTIEDECGRDRTQKVSVTMDLDILMYVDKDDIFKVHSDVYDYNHVLLPFLELGGHLIDPNSGKPFEELRRVNA